MHKIEVKNHPPILTWMSMDSPDEWETLEKMKGLVTVPWLFHHLALMSDSHVGFGPCVGAVVAMKEAVSPSSVGSDIGCGMAAIKFKNFTANDLPFNLKEIRTLLEERIPVGFNSHGQVKKLTDKLGDELWSKFYTLDSRVHNLKDKARIQSGTLGGGNHFYEICIDTHNNVWLLLHSGSRNIGKEIADIHIKTAKTLVHNRELADPNYAVLLAGTPEFKSYINDLQWAQDYAFLNRRVMIELGLGALKHFFEQKGKILETEEPILAHHNYVEYAQHFGEWVYVTRKGAINAEKGRMGIIPGSMGTQSFIVKGLGNPDSFNSAPHGAGRRMSRGQAKKKFTLDDLREQTKGVECRTDHGVLDEIPGAYKSIKSVMENSADLVEVVAELKQVLCIKG
jgi:tRNA-splicing ligase RtcB